MLERNPIGKHEQCRSHRECRVVHLPIFSLSAQWPNINSARQCYIAGKTQVKSYLSANWARTKSVCRKIGLEQNLFVSRLGSNEVCLLAD